MRIGQVGNWATTAESNTLVRATAGAVSVSFGTMPYFALYKYPPCQSNRRFVAVKFWDFGVALARGGGRGVGRPQVSGNGHA